MAYKIKTGDVITELKKLDSNSVNMCVTSPPYWELRDYGTAGQIGLEPTPNEYVDKIVEVFREVRRVLRKDGTVWVNLGDSYCAHPGQRKETDAAGPKQQTNEGAQGAPSRSVPGLKPKDLAGIPWRVAFALQADGWWLRSDIIWAKPAPMPESVTDRPTRSHEYIFLLSKSDKYYYDHEAIKEPAVCGHPSGNGYKRDSRESFKDRNGARGSDEPWVPSGKGGKNAFRGQGHFREVSTGPENRDGRDMKNVGAGETRNKRDVWTVNTKPFREAHFATFPEELIRPCVLAGCPAAKDGEEAGTVLDTFAGAGTTMLVCEQERRNSIGIELNPEYVAIAERRLARATAQGRLL